MGHEIINLLSLFAAKNGVEKFCDEAAIAAWRARRTLRAMAKCGAIACRSSTCGFGWRVDSPWFVEGGNYTRRYRLMPFERERVDGVP